MKKDKHQDDVKVTNEEAQMAGHIGTTVVRSPLRATGPCTRSPLPRLSARSRERR